MIGNMKRTPKHKQGGLKALELWVGTYRKSVGPAAEDCVVTLHSLLAQKMLKPSSCELLVELLEILEGLCADPITISCAVLHVAGEGGSQVDGMVEVRPGKVRKQYAELKKLKLYESDSSLSITERSAEGLRRLLLALVKDVRVVMIDLAWQLVLLRHARADHELAQELARETMLIHAPLANRLGIWQLKWELEDLAFRYQDPGKYRRVAQLVAEHRTQRERFIRGFMDKLVADLEEAGIPAQVNGRPKHMYSIWRKMQRKGLDFHELFDVRAVRVLVDDLPACYSALGLVHTAWQPIPGEFDDYITMPKGNNYQSLHTAVADPEGMLIRLPSVSTRCSVFKCLCRTHSNWQKRSIHRSRFASLTIVFARKPTVKTFFFLFDIPKDLSVQDVVSGRAGHLRTND